MTMVIPRPNGRAAAPPPPSKGPSKCRILRALNAMVYMVMGAYIYAVFPRMVSIISVSPTTTATVATHEVASFSPLGGRDDPRIPGVHRSAGVGKADLSVGDAAPWGETEEEDSPIPPRLRSEKSKPPSDEEGGTHSRVPGAPELTPRNVKTIKKKWKRTRNTVSRFPVAGVNLGTYGFDNGGWGAGRKDVKGPGPPFELFEDFNIGHKIHGNEGWWHLQRYKQTASHESLSFYVDKVAQKRWLPSQGYDIPQPYELRYLSELLPVAKVGGKWKGWKKSDMEKLGNGIKALLPHNKSFCAKPSHLSLAEGVWLVNDGGDLESGGKKPLVGRGRGRGMEVLNEVKKVDRNLIAASLAADMLGKKDPTDEVAQLRVEPGVVVEERYTMKLDGRNHKQHSFFNRGEDLPAMEFKVMVIWGRVWAAHVRRGKQTIGWWRRDGMQVMDETRRMQVKIPDFVDFPRVVELAERRAKHMDFLRVDIFVGIPASDTHALRKSASQEERLAAVRHVLSEVEMQTTSRPGKELEEEGARLWIAGYKMGNYRLVPNSEVPKEFLEHGMLPSTYSAQVSSENREQ